MSCLLAMLSRCPSPQTLKRVEVIEDDESEIIEAVRRMSDRYDFVVTRYAKRFPSLLISYERFVN